MFRRVGGRKERQNWLNKNSHLLSFIVHGMVIDLQTVFPPDWPWSACDSYRKLLRIVLANSPARSIVIIEQQQRYDNDKRYSCFWLVATSATTAATQQSSRPTQMPNFATLARVSDQSLVALSRGANSDRFQVT
jgi:hypothetical protein